MSTAYNYRENFWIELSGNAEIECNSTYNWTVKLNDDVIAFGIETNQITAAIKAENACDIHVAGQHPFDVNLLVDGTVQKKDGEIIGTWHIDDTDALYHFTPKGAAEYALTSHFRSLLREEIKEWHSGSINNVSVG